MHVRGVGDIGIETSLVQKTGYKGICLLAKLLQVVVVGPALENLKN
jgi:hypothetical protein